MKKKLSGRFLASLVIFSLVGQIAWVVENMYFNVFIYKMFRADAAAISTMVAASAIAAALTTLLMGALSDKVGKRKLFIAGGYIIWGISIQAFSLIRLDMLSPLAGSAAAAMTLGVSLVIVMDCVMTFFGSTANDACFNAWLTDSTGEGDRGKAEGINSMMPLLAVLVVFGGFMSFDLDQAKSWTIIYMIVGSVVFLAGILGLFLLEDPDIKPQKEESVISNILYGFRPEVIRQNRLLYLILAAFILFNISIQIFMPYLILYYTVALKLENYVLIMAPAILLASVVTFFYGRIYDRLGFLRSVVPSLLMLMSGYTLLYFFRNTPLVFIGSLLMLSGYLSGMAVFGAMIRDNTPAGKAGRLQGLRIFSQVLIPGVIGPWIGALVLKNADTILNDDGTKSFIPNENIYLAAFIAALVTLAMLLVCRRLFRRKRLNNTD
ncbi:MAG: MFS transporter [Lachnospiraceae bacterium]|nr:MFS transporter [Lachnospiraceae bacterium]